MNLLFEKTHELERSLHKWSSRGIFAILDQGLISGSNFVIAILLARWLAPQQYGSYALAFEIFLFLAALYGALILEPMSVFGPSVYSGNLSSYLGGLLRIHCVLSIVVVAALFATAAAFHVFRPASLFPNTLVGISLATPCLLLFWLARRGYYILFLPQKAVLGACLYSALLLAGVALLYRFKSLSPFSAFLLLAAGALVTGPLMLRRLKARLAPATTSFSIMDIVRRHWAFARLLILPSECYENFPMTVVEAFSCGTPVVCSRHGAMREIVNDGETGLHFTPGNPADLAATLELAWSNPQLLRAMGKAARREYEEKYTAEQNYAALMAIYQQAMGLPIDDGRLPIPAYHAPLDARQPAAGS